MFRWQSSRLYGSVLAATPDCEMNLIPTRIHALLDYLLSLFVIASPWVLGFAFDGPETWVPVGVGVVTIVYSLATQYELGAFRGISMAAHLRLDFVVHAFLLASPWLFAFSHLVGLPHVFLGLLGIGLMALTRPTLESARGENQREHAPPREMGSA